MWSTSPAFKAALESPVHTMAVKAQVLDTDFNVVEGGEFFDTGSTGEVQNFIADGSVDLDIARTVRRHFTLSLLNENGEFSPTSDWAGLFYVDRLIRIWRGIRIGNSVEYVPLGTFAIDAADVVAERNMSIVALAGSDLWKKLVKAKLGGPVKYTSGTSVVDVIEDLAARAGVTMFVLDDLSHRTSNTRNIQADINYERKAVIGDEISKLATDWALDVYFDQLGRMVVEESGLSRSPVWTYRTGETTTLLTAKVSYTDDRLYNHIIVTGTADENNPIYAEAEDDNPASPTSIDRIGRRTFEYESKFIANASQAQQTANSLLAQHLLVVEDVELDTICNPAFEGNDVLQIEEEEFTRLNRQLRIRSFTVPLSSSRQTIKLKRDFTVS